MMNFRHRAMIGRKVFDPLSLNPYVWLDASVSDSVTEDTGKVSQWNDLSGNGRHAIQPTASYRPVYEPANNRLYFNLASMYGPVSLSANFPNTVFVVFQKTNAADEQQIWGLTNNFSSTTNRNAEIYPNNISRVSFYRGDGTATFSEFANFVEIGTNIALCAFALDSTSVKTFVNGMKTTHSSSLTRSSNYYSLGVRIINNGFDESKYYYEVLHYPSYLSDNDIQKITNYLKIKWSLTF